MFNNAEFFRAFAQHGLLVDVEYLPEIGAPVPFKAGFKSPSELMLSDLVESDEYELEIERASAPALTEGSRVRIDADVYTLRHAPRSRGDGAFAIARMSKVAT